MFKLKKIKIGGELSDAVERLDQVKIIIEGYSGGGDKSETSEDRPLRFFLF